MELKMRINKAISSAQSLGVFDVNDESKVRFIVEGAGPSNVIEIRARLLGQPNFIALDTVNGSENKVINVFTYEELQVECTTFDATGSEIKIYAASFSEAGGSAIDSIGVPSGSNLTDFTSFSFDSSDNSVTITGNNSTKTIDLVANVSTAGYTPDTPADWSPAPTTVSEGLDQLAGRMVDVETNKIDSTEKGAASGVAPLNALSKIDSTYLPSYVDDVEEYANLAAFPPTGEASKIYVALDTNKTYRWATTVYVEISPSAVTSVNGQTGIVTLTKSDVGLGNVDNTSDLNKPVSTATQNAINALSDSFKYNQIVYVDKANTNTYVADGSINKPYKSIKAMYDAITDASASKRYACIIAPGTYTELATIQLKGWIDLTSAATDTVIIGTVGNVSVKWSNNNPGRVFIKDIGFSVNLEVLNDNPSGTSGMVFDLDNVDGSNITFNGRGGGRDFFQLRNDCRFQTCTIKSAATTIFDCTIISSLVLNDVGCTVPDGFGSAATVSLHSNYIGGISVTATNYDIYTDSWGNNIPGTLTIVSNAPSFPCYYNHDVSSYPQGAITLSGSNPAQVVATSVAQALSYTPSTPANWTDPDPTQVRKALDDLAANKIATSQKGAANGVAPLNALGKIDSTYLPSEEVSEYANAAAFPPIGETSKIYVALDTKKIYRWNSSAYEELSAAPVTSINSYTGDVVLSSADINNTQVDETKWNLSDGSSVRLHLEELATRTYDLELYSSVFNDTKEPTGFLNRTESSISFNDGSRIFQISPFVVTAFEFYVKGVFYSKSSTESITIPNSPGNHYIYYNFSGVLSSTQTLSSDLFQENALVAIVYWNTETNSHTYFADERHGITMDGATHTYLHTIFGARYLSGLALQGFSVDGAGTSAADAQFTSDSGSIRDEDILIQISAQSQIPILYRENQLWRKKTADSFPVIYSGTAGYTGSNGRLPYNQYTGGAWQLTEIGNSSYVLVHFFGTNDKDNPVVGIQGITEYNSIAAARLNANAEITSLSGLPFAEFVAIGSVIFESSTSYANTPKARVISTDTGANYVDFRGTQLYTPAGEATTHGLLSGLSNDDHLQYHTDARGDIRYYTKTQIDTDVIKKAGTTAFTGDQSMGGFKLTNLANPVALTDAVNLQTLNAALGSSGDIFEKSFSLVNSQSPAANITDFVFANGVVRSFEAFVSVAITATSNLYETFEVRGIQKDSDWFISISSEGDNSGVILSITSAGQMQYITPNYVGFVSGTLKFRAITTSV